MTSTSRPSGRIEVSSTVVAAYFSRSLCCFSFPYILAVWRWSRGIAIPTIISFYLFLCAFDGQDRLFSQSTTRSLESIPLLVNDCVSVFTLSPSPTALSTPNPASLANRLVLSSIALLIHARTLPALILLSVRGCCLLCCRPRLIYTRHRRRRQCDTSKFSALSIDRSCPRMRCEVCFSCVHSLTSAALFRRPVV
jgi:hypothetical protein